MPQLKFIKEKDTTIYPITIPQGVITDVTNKKNLADSLDEKVDKENGTASNLTVTPVSDGSTALTANGNVEFGDNTSNGEGSKLVLKTGTNSACQITLESDADGKDPSINFSYGTDHPERGLSITGYTSTYPQGAISLNGGGTLKFPEFTGEDTFARKSEVDNKADSSAVPTKTSQLTNDSGFLTSHQDISGKLDKEKGTATNLTVNSSLIMPSGYFSVPNKAYIYCAGNEGGYGSIHFPDFSFLDIQNNYTLALTSDIPTTDTTLSTSSTNPIANSTVKNALDEKANSSDINNLSTWSDNIIHGSGDYIVVDKDLSSLTGSGVCVLKSLNKFSKDSGYSSTDSVDTSYANQMRVGTRILTAADSTTGYCMVGTIIAAYTQYTNVDGQQKFATGKYLAAVGSNSTNVNDICNLVLLVPRVSSIHRYAYQIFNLWDLTKISSLEEQLNQLSTRVSTLEGSGS